MKYVLIPTNRGTKTVLEENIIRIEACSNYCKIYFNNERPLVVAKVLHWFQDLLPEDTFCRIHRTHLVNRLYITDVLGANHLTLSNGEIIQMSRRKGIFTKPCCYKALKQAAFLSSALAFPNDKEREYNEYNG